MKAFSFSSILKNFGKQLSSLASQMHSDDLRVNLGTISVLSRVNPLFSHCASRRASFGTSRRVSHFAAILTILFTIGVGNVWGAYDVPANGKVTLSKKVNNGGRFNVEASGVYHFRPASGYSWSDNGIKTQSNSGGVVFFIDKSTDVTVQIAHLEAKNAHDVTVHVYSITEEEYKQFDDNKGGAEEKDRTYTSLSLTHDNPFVIEIAAEKTEFEGTKKLESGYYVIVPTGEKSNTYFKSITFTSSSSGGGECTEPTITFNNGSYTVGGSALDLSTLFDSNSNGTVTYTVTNANGTGATNNGTSFTATAAGTATVKATQAANGDYCSGETTATITVNAASGGGNGDCYSNLAYSGEANMPSGWTIVSNEDPKPQINDNTIAMQRGSVYAYSSGAPTRGMYFDANQNATISITSYCTNSRAFCLVEKNGDNYSIIQTWDAEETLTASIVSGRTYYLTSKAGSKDAAKCNIKIISFSDCASTPEPETYSITYECDGAISGCPSNTTEQTALPNPLPSAPTKTGYTFVGWYTDAEKTIQAVAGATLEENTTLYAKWNINSYNTTTNFTNVSMTGEESLNQFPSTLQYGSSLSRTFVADAGYSLPETITVTGAEYTWNPSTGVLSITNVTGEVSVTITGELVEYTITYEGLEGATHSNPDTYTIESGTITFIAPSERTGYTFAGWDPTSIEQGSTGNKTVTATWTAKTTTITIDANTANHGSTTPGNVTATYGSALPSFTAATGASGYSLIGYFTAATSGTKVINADGTLVASTDYADGSGKWKSEDATLTLFAQYEEDASGGDCTNEYNSPSTTTYATKTFLDVSATNYNTSASTNYYLTYSAYWMHNTYKTWTWWNSNDAERNKDASTYTYANAESEGYLATASSASGNNGYGGKKIHLTRRDSIWFTGATSVACLNKGHSSAIFTMEVFQVASNGTLSKVGSSYTNATTSVTSLVCSSLNASNYYLVKFYAIDDSNTYLYQVRFGNACADAPSCTTPTTAFANGSYTVGGSALNLTTLFTSNSTGEVTYTVKNANGTGASIDGTNFTATSAGTATVTATQAADDDYCEKVMDATITVNATPVTPEPSGEPIITNTLATGAVTWSSSISTTDETNITNLTALAATGLTIDGNGNTNNGGQTAKITGTETNKNVEKYMSLGFRVACGKKLVVSEIEIPVQPVTSNTNNFEAVLTDGTTTITGTINNVTNGELQNITFNSYGELVGNVTLKLYAWGWTQGYRLGQAVKIYGTIEEGATPAATITWNTQPVGGQVGDEDFAYAVSCSDGSAVTVTSENEAVATIVDGKLHYVAEGTTRLIATATDACGNTITQISNDFIVTAASVDPDPEPGTETCITLGSDNSKDIKSDGTATVGNYTITASKVNWQSDNAKLDNNEDYIVFTNSTGIIAANITAKNNAVVVTYSSSIDGTTNVTTEEVAATDQFAELTLNVPNGTKYIKLQRKSGSSIYVSQVCLTEGSPLPSCTTPVLSNLENQKVCPGNNVSWTAIVNNTATLQENGETIAYQWNKKGNNTVLSNTATLTLNDITEAAGGTYVVTATVSANGKASATATKEVTLTVTPATATPTITASASTVYAGNPVTLTATCVSSEVTYQWYTCNDAEGNGALELDNAENAEYTPSTATAGTYYYKVIVTGGGTHSCGTAEKVYELVVSAAIDASDCTTYFWFPYAQDATTNGVTNNENKFFGNSPKTGQNNAGTYKFELDDITYTATRNTADANFTISFTVPENSIGTMAINCKGSSSNPLYLKHTDNTPMLVSNVSSYKSFVIENITPGTWTLQSAANWTLSGMAVKVCSGNTCTDPQVTATVNNATICAGTENVTFTATNYANGAEFQWQKKNGNTWEDISGATSDTYTIPSVATAHAGQYRVIAKKECNRISEEVKLIVLTAPTFNTFATTASVMKGNALAISDVQATGATGYAWYKSADNTFNAAEDTKVSTSKDLLLAAASIPEAADEKFYLFCVASNSCGSVTSNAITVTVTPFISEECATAGNEGEHEFEFDKNKCSEATLGAKKVWSTSSNDKYLIYTAPEGRYFATAKVQVAHSSKTIAAYAYTTNGTNWTAVELTGLTTSLTTKEITFPENVTGFRIGRKFDDKGVGSGNFYLYEACFTYENACTETTLTPSEPTKDHNLSLKIDFMEPTFTLKSGETTLEGQTLTYTSSNTAIATVDEDGKVTFEGMTGTVTITAAYAGGTIDEVDYCACQGSYTITVGCTDQAPMIVAAAGTKLDGCNNSITLEAKMKDGTTAFADGTFQWYRDGVAIDGATSASYTVVRAGTYTVSRTYTCMTMSSNSAVVTNENVEPEVERLTPFQYYHVDKTYSNQMKNRHLFAVKSYGTYEGKRYHLTATRNGETLDLSSSTAFFTIPSSDNAVDTVMIDLNELKGKYSANDKIVITCAPINNCHTASAITASITIYVIDQTPTLALICSGANGDGTRVTEELVVGGDFLTGYNKADLCQQIGNTTFDPNTEWGFYTLLKEDYIVTPVNGYAQFNKLNYEPFDILLLTDYPKSSRSEAAQKIIDDMAELCDYRPLLSFKTHFQSADWKDKTTGEYKYTKWVKKGFTTAPVVPAQSALYADIVCYAHPMFSNINNTSYTYHNDADHDQLIYKILDRAGYEKKNDIAKGIQGFELADASNFVTIGLIHNDASAAEVEHTGTDFNGDGIVDATDTHKHVRWTNGENDRKLVAIAERQANVEARMILFSINCGAQSLQTEGGRQVILQCLKYLYNAENLIEPAECHLTFDNKHGDNKWSNHLNWAPRYTVCPTENDEVRIAAPCTVDITDASVLSVQILEGGSLTINQGAALVVAGPITRFDKETDISSATESEDILIGSDDKGNGTLIFSNANGTTKATVQMYSTAKADMVNMSAATSTWQYIGTPHSDVQNAADNYYESWLYQYDTGKEGWVVIPNGGPLVPFKGYCVTHPENPHTYTMTGTLAATTNQDITIPAGKFVVVANSWTAPIQIHNFEDGDLEGLTDKTVYLFNTGSDPEGDGTITPDASATQETRYATGTYISIPIHSAPYTGDATISSMQGFYVVGGDAEGTLHLNYDKLVRPKEEQNIIGGPMHAPARITDTDNEPQVAKFLFRGKRYDDRLIILERPDFTRGYDSGWDGEQWGGNAAAPMSYVVAETRYDAVSAIPEYEGTVIGFRAGEDNIYTIYFDYDGMEEALYLLDTDTKIYTRVLKGNSYTFACPDKAEHNRFILTRKAPQIATSTENINTGENAKVVKFIKDDKIFIFVNGMLYDATGKMVVR